MKKSFNSNEDNVVGFCGEYPPSFIDVDITSDPNFIFQNDPQYEVVKLFDSEGNSVLVNSFFECQHYVRGGWDAIPNQRNESFFHNSLLVFSLLSIFIGYLAIKKYYQKGRS
tara:strand:+ start:228 stop:563 length:336 start_codon:yes stop_codon:yes gene_type:complete